MVTFNCENFDAVKTIKDVVYVPGLTTNLSSVSKMFKKELIVTFSQQGCGLCDQDGCAIRGEVCVTETNLNEIYKLYVSGDGPCGCIREENTKALAKETRSIMQEINETSAWRYSNWNTEMKHHVLPALKVNSTRWRPNPAGIEPNRSWR
jgi:hypothetical protein